MIVAEIKSSLQVCKSLNETAGINFLTQIHSQGFEWLSLDGMQRRNAIMEFIGSQVSLNVKLEDAITEEVVDCRGKYFKDLPKGVQINFMNSTVHVVTHEHTPYSKCPVVFRSINDGANLNNQEWRAAIITPVSDAIRTLAETTFQDVWPKVEGYSSDKIKRMYDSETLLHMFMELMPEIKEKDFASKDHCDNFYFLGENRHCLANVPEYNSFAQAQDIITMAMECFRQQRSGLKKIPKKTMWAVLYICREIYNKNLTVTDYHELFEVVRNCDKTLENDSKVKQAEDIQNAEKNLGKTAEEASDLFPDDHYYWRWINRNTASKFRSRRIKTLLPKVSLQFGKFTSVAAVAA